MALLRVNGISKTENHKEVLSSIELTLNTGEKLALAGETGAGKSTLLKIIAGLTAPDKGEVWLENERVKGPYEKLLPGHPRIAYLSQHFELRPNFFVHEVLEMASKISQKRANEIYLICRIEHLLARKTTQLSGGERQRVALARLITTDPILLLLDEPFSNLDRANKKIIQGILHDLSLYAQLTYILVSHEAADTLSWADKIMVLRNGKMVQTDTPSNVYRHPADEYCAGLMGDYNILNPSSALLPASENHLNNPGMSAIIRPEQIQVSNEGTNATNGIKGIKGTVERIIYFGSHYQLLINTSEQPLIVKTDVLQVTEQDEVGISINGPIAWIP